jgi:hypothetical protein
MEVSGQLHAPAALLPRERAPGTHMVVVWEGPRAGLKTVSERKISTPCRESNPDSPARNQSLYRLSYHDS